MNVVIVESGAKAKTIQKHLESLFPDRSFQVIACFGHIRDLPEKSMGIDTATWEVEYVDSDKKGTITRLKQAVKDANMVYLAADPDREGEAIAYHLKERLKIKSVMCRRITFHEITRDAIARAFQAPREIDMPLVHAQETRRILDRVVGYELSPLLWRRYCTSNLSAGRVQSTALQMIVQRAKEAEKHNAETFWKLVATFSGNIPATLFYEQEEARWTTSEEAKKMFDFVLQIHQKAKEGWNMTTSSRISKKSPSPPFITTTLQKEAYELHKIPGKQVMSIAQKLYESGYITYMRTDSPAMSEQARMEALGYIRDNVGANLGQERIYKAKGDHSQEAHECIRPSHMEVTSDQLRYNEELTPTHIKVYDLIWRRAVASQMVDAEYVEYDYTIEHAKMKRYTFSGTTRILQKLGYLQVYAPKTKVLPDDIPLWQNPSSKVQLQSLHSQGDATRGQGLYHEPSIIKAMEKAGIGRPSTYASIIEKLFTKKYIVHGTNPQCDIEVQDHIWDGDKVATEKRTIHLGGSEKDRFVPTSLGYKVVEYIAETYPSLLDIQFTSRMEQELDEISKGTLQKQQALQQFYQDFHASIQKQMDVATSSKKKDPETDEIKPKMKILTSWEKLNCNLVEARFGPTLYDVKKRKFISVTPYMEWKGKQISDIDEADVKFLMSFPRKVKADMGERNALTVEAGPYGFYIKDGKKNITLPKEQWQSLQDGTLTAAQINLKKTPWGKK